MSQPEHHVVGQRISFDGALCTVRYRGPVQGTTGIWLGVEWDDPVRGKHDGSHKDVRYFTCLSKSLTAASFVRPTRPAENPQSFIAALKNKYAAVDGEGGSSSAPAQQIVVGGKLAEEVGFDKIRRQQAQVKELKVVLLDGHRVARARDDGEPSIEETCPSIIQLDLSRNLLQHVRPVVEVCRSLPVLNNLSINGNRFTDVLDDEYLKGDESLEAFAELKDLALGDTLLSWSELCFIASRCSSLASLTAGTNQLTSLPQVNYGTLAQTLTTLDLEYNEFTTLADVQSLTGLTALRNLQLKGNNISALAPPGSDAPVFASTLQYLDLSHNDIEDWTFVDCLPHHFPGLTALRISKNPVYDKQARAGVGTSSSDESYMYAVARLGQLKSLNYSNISPSDRSNAEMFYLSRIAKQLAGVSETEEDGVKAQHPRYAELCEIYGEPDVIRRQDVNPAFLEARLIKVNFHAQDGAQKTTRIPKSTDIYAVKGIAGRLFGLPPLKVSLIWETGEWDPVAGIYDKDGDSSDGEGEEDISMGQARLNDRTDPEPRDDEDKTGRRWVKREVTLRDGPRQLGYCVDGPDVTIRIES